MFLCLYGKICTKRLEAGTEVKVTQLIVFWFCWQFVLCSVYEIDISCEVLKSVDVTVDYLFLDRFSVHLLNNINNPSLINHSISF